METKGILYRGPEEEKLYVIPDRLLMVPRRASALLLSRFLGKST